MLFIKLLFSTISVSLAEASPSFAEIEDGCLHIKVSDTGKGIADINQAVQPFFTSAPSDERSGMGFTIMQTFMDEFKVPLRLLRTPGCEAVNKIEVSNNF